MNLKRLAQVVSALLMLLVLAACGDQATATTAPASNATTAPASSATTAPAGNATTAPSGSTTAAPAGSVIKIGLIGPLTGPSAAFGAAIQSGVEMAVNEVNADPNNGLNGRKIVIIPRDDKATADVGKAAALDLINNEKVDALIGVANTAVATVVSQVVQQNKIPWLDTVSTGSKFIDTALPGQSNYAFRDSLRDDIQTHFAVDYAVQKGYKKIALMSDTSTYGQSGHDDLVAYGKTKGITYVEDQTYKVGDQDMTAQLQKISGAGADVIVNWGLGAEAAQILKSRQKLGLNIPMVGSWGLSLPSFFDLAGPLADGTYMPQSFIVDQAMAANAKAKDFITRYRSTYNDQRVGFPSGLAQSYDGMHLLALALKGAGTNMTHDSIRDALENVDSYDGVVKSYKQPFQGKNGTNAKPHEALTLEDFKMAVAKDGLLIVPPAQ